MIILCQTDHYYLFFSYITLVFYNIRRISYRMDMVTYVRMLSWHLTYWMGYGNYTCLHYHIIFDDHYYFPDVHPYFTSVVTATFLLKSYLPISNTTVTRFCHRWLYPRTNLTLPYLFFEFMSDSTSSAFPTRSLVKDSPICNVSICFQPMITSHNFKNRDTRKAFLKKSARICSVLQYEIDMLLLSTRSSTKNIVYWCALIYRYTISSHCYPFLFHFLNLGIIYSVWFHILGIP